MKNAFNLELSLVNFINIQEPVVAVLC